LESELFGHERGAFTGAIARRLGRFEAAHQGTLLLDEISETSLQFQAKLLRALQEGELDRIGRDQPVRVDVRIIATTNRCLRDALQAGTFRQDLFFRLNVVSLRLPPLRERPQDVPLLARYFAEKHRGANGSQGRELSEAAIQHLQRYAWPGNVRELRNVIERAMIVSSGKSLDLSIPAIASAEPVASQALEDVERTHILSVLEKTRWRLTGQGGAAERLGLKRTTLQSRMKKLGLKRPTS
jgi:transcriptional regulator with GAF, ATPase, and Fis domain